MNTQENVMNFDREIVAGSTKKAMAAASAGKRDLWMCSLESLRVIEGFNVRVKNADYEQHIRALADSIKMEGFFAHEALAGYVANENGVDVVYITDGHCRREAALLAVSEGAELERLPVIVAPQGTSKEDLTVAMLKTNTGKPLSPYEVGLVCRRLVGWGWEVDEVAHRLGIASTAYVEGLLMLVGSPRSVREMVMSGKVSAAIAIDALKKHGDKALEVLQAALGRAKLSGSNKVTGKHLADAQFKKTVKKTAPQMYGVLREIKVDPGYSLIDHSLRKKIDELIELVAKAAQKDSSDAEKSKGTNDDADVE